MSRALHISCLFSLIGHMCNLECPSRERSGKSFWKQQAFPSTRGPIGPLLVQISLEAIIAERVVNLKDFTLQLLSPQLPYHLLGDDFEDTADGNLEALANILVSLSWEIRHWSLRRGTSTEAQSKVALASATSSELWTETTVPVFHVNPIAGREDGAAAISCSRTPLGLLSLDWARADMAAAADRRPNLGQRIIGSAKGLACSTFSGVPGIEAELRSRDLSGIGKRVAAPARRGLTASDFTDDVSRSSSSAAKVESFRSVVEAEPSSVEQDFKNFISGQNFNLFETSQGPRPNSEDIGFKHRELGRQTWQGVYGPANRDSDAKVEGSEPVWERSSQGEVVYQEDGRPEWRWTHEWRRLKKQHQGQNHHSLDEEMRTANPSETEMQEQMDDVNLYQSVALARLKQVRRHLAVSEHQQRDLPTWKEDWEKHLERCDFSIDREMDSYTPPLEEAHRPLEQERYYFHCPYRECHHRLLRQNENLSLSIRQRACVHDGCGYVSQTVEEWLKHVTSTHHGTQEGPSEHSSNTCYRGQTHITNASCTRCGTPSKLSSPKSSSVWITRKGSRLELKAAPTSRQELGSIMMGDVQHENHVRGSTEMRAEEWDSPR
ncbi:hypothetical protein AC579_3699 [Pseudocercospora musae]|uniref:C2H2-type domain-containing protein n=1 Tax=Pseudocercospora musae TaxID=113226 RepID=A0A139IIT8_9PEZI|nr:hypothetical protein AC579_3699 [Pseudocercospora musae]